MLRHNNKAAAGVKAPAAAPSSAEKKVIPVGKYFHIPQILIRQHAKRMSLAAQAHKEMKEGGFLRRYLERKKAQTDARYRKVAQRLRDWKQNNKSDLRVLAQVPLHDYIRWKETDPHFWEDNKNLKSLKRDNDDARVYV